LRYFTNIPDFWNRQKGRKLMKMKTNDLHIRSKIWVEDHNGKVIFGLGRLKILEAIIRHGSIHAAAKELKMSYRAVWGKIKDTEERLGQPLLVRQVGGASGGGSELTPLGKNLFKKFNELQDHVETEVEKLFVQSFPPSLK
jgi:molybdate transport system regulatory protein